MRSDRRAELKARRSVLYVAKLPPAGELRTT